MDTNVSEIKFRFRYVDKQGNPSLFSYKGIVNANEIILGKFTLPFDAFYDSIVRDDRMLLFVDPTLVPEKLQKKTLLAESGASYLAISFSPKKAKELKKFMDKIASAKNADGKKAGLQKEGKGHLFRTSICPKCGATVDLSELDQSQYTYCNYCESLFDRDMKIIDDGDKYRACDECGMFDRVKGYTEFYFYFLLFIYGFRYKRRFVCTNCAHKIFVKTLLWNFIFILGIIPSIVIKIKSMIGRDQRFKDLTLANKFAAKGNFMEASRLYQNIYMNHSEHPGILRNEALAYSFGGQEQQAGGLLQRSLKACANYQPTLNILTAIAMEDAMKKELAEQERQSGKI